jgi:hypothetical protein
MQGNPIMREIIWGIQKDKHWGEWRRDKEKF